MASRVWVAEDVILNGALVPGWTEVTALPLFTLDRRENILLPFQPVSDLDALALTVLLVLVRDNFKGLTNADIMEATGIKRSSFFKLKKHVKDPMNPNCTFPAGKEGAHRPTLISDEVLREAYGEITRNTANLTSLSDRKIDELLAAHISDSAQVPKELCRMTMWRYRKRLIAMGMIPIRGEENYASREETFVDIMIPLSQAALLLSFKKRGVNLDCDIYKDQAFVFRLGTDDDKPTIYTTIERDNIGKIYDAAYMF
jgi:hypothetical protein